MNRTGPSRWIIAALVPLMLFLSLAAWAFSSPVGASPDEDFHLASTWCGLGERAGLCDDPGNGTYQRLVPASLPGATCFAFHPDESADCWISNKPGMATAKRANADGLYPRVFYAVMSVFASRDIPASVITMRLFNSLLAVALLTVVFWALPRWIRPALIVSVAATSIPLGVFVLASINPSSWAVLSGATVWLTLYGATQTAGRRRIVLCALALTGALIGAGARADAAAYAIFATGIAVILGARARRGQLLPLLTAAAVVVISIAFYLNASQSSSVVSGIDGVNNALSGSQIVSNVFEVPSLWIGALGGWALGWLDTALPAVVRVMSTLVFAGALFVGLRRVHPRRALATVLALVAMWAVPFILLFQSHTIVGSFVQPRYILPLLVIAIGVASLRRDGDAAWSGMRLWLAGAMLTIAYTVALHTNIQRYTTGLSHISLDPGAGAQWWWNDAPSPVLTWVLGTLAYASIFVLFSLVVPRPEKESSTASKQSPNTMEIATEGVSPGDSAGPTFATDVAAA